MKEKRVFVKLYGWLIQHFGDISGVELKVLLSLSYKMGFNDNTLLMDKVLYDMLEEQLQMTHRSVLRAIRSLERKGLVKRHSFFLTVSTNFAGKRL